MGKVVVTEFLTIDGVMEDPGGAENFERGGWAFKYERGPDGDKFKLDELLEAKAHLLGRRTWEEFAKAWPSRDGEFADRMNSMPKYVVSSTTDGSAWENTTVLSGDLADEVRKLKQDVDGVILVAGSAQLVNALADQDLVDEYRLMVFPVVLGAGKRLFDRTSADKPLKLVDSKPAGECLILIYEPASSASA
jgi:dihydrofolate reductase